MWNLQFVIPINYVQRHPVVTTSHPCQISFTAYLIIQLQSIKKSSIIYHRHHHKEAVPIVWTCPDMSKKQTKRDHLTCENFVILWKRQKTFQALSRAKEREGERVIEIFCYKLIYQICKWNFVVGFFLLINLIDCENEPHKRNDNIYL